MRKFSMGNIPSLVWSSSQSIEVLSFQNAQHLNSCSKLVHCCDRTTIKSSLPRDEVYLSANRTCRRISKTRGCSADTIQNLLRTPVIRKHLASAHESSYYSGSMFGRRNRRKRSCGGMRRLANGFFASLLHDTNREEIYREIWLEPIQ